MQDRPTRDTSQVGDWENFRNEVLNNKYERITSKKIFSGKTKVGKLRFDYVQTVRPIDGKINFLKYMFLYLIIYHFFL